MKFLIIILLFIAVQVQGQADTNNVRVEAIGGLQIDGREYRLTTTTGKALWRNGKWTITGDTVSIIEMLIKENFETKAQLIKEQKSKSEVFSRPLSIDTPTANLIRRYYNRKVSGTMSFLEWNEPDSVKPEQIKPPADSVSFVSTKDFDSFLTYLRDNVSVANYEKLTPPDVLREFWRWAVIEYSKRRKK